MIKIFKKKPYIIAEIGANHNGSIGIAKKTISLAKKSGCDAVKFQSWDESLISKKIYEKNLNLLREVKKYKLNFKKLKILRKFSKKKSIDFGTTIFNEKELKEALSLKCNFIKIASMDINNLYLLKKVAKIKEKVIISTGTATEKEIKLASNIFHREKKKNITFLHCLTLYPPKDLNIINLKNIDLIKKITNFPSGYSDHSTLKEAPLIATSLGATVIEKHFTINKNLKGWDHKISANFQEMYELNKSCKIVNAIIGKDKKIISKDEKKMSKIMRRGIYAIKNIKKNEILSTKNILLQRPETKLGANFYHTILGKKAKKNIKENSSIKLNDLAGKIKIFKKN